MTSLGMLSFFFVDGSTTVRKYGPVKKIENSKASIKIEELTLKKQSQKIFQMHKYLYSIVLLVYIVHAFTKQVVVSKPY